MRIYTSFKEMLSEVERDVVEMGTRKMSTSVQNISNPDDGYEMKEIIGYSYKLENWNDFPSCFTEAELTWITSEFKERVSGFIHNPGKAWLHRRNIWESFLNDEGRFDYTYSERIGNQLQRVIEELKVRPNSRQAIILIYREYDNLHWGGKMRIPCSLSYQFMIQNLRLNVVYNMRSCDVFTHFKFDAILACKLLEYVAGNIFSDIGTLTHNIGSLHCFKKDTKGIF